MRDIMPDLRDKIVLDLACGSGRYSRVALENGATQVIGVDNSLAMLDMGRRDLPNGHFAGATTEAIPLAGESCDVVLCGLALGHLPTLEASLSEIARVLRRGGLGLISDFHPFLALTGKQRTFTAPDGRVFAVEHYPHLYSDMLTVARSVGLRIEDIREPRLKIDGATQPAVIVYRLTKG